MGSHDIVFDVPPEFKVESVVGQGAYGAVCKAIWGDRVVAIKKIPNYSRSIEQARHVLRELQIMKSLAECDQVVACHGYFRPVGGEQDVYIVMDWYPSDLSYALKKRVIATEEAARFVVCQLLLALHAMHTRNIMHRDLSIRNILIDTECRVAVCDFGLARFFDPEERLSMGVVTQWYRAPEIVTDAPYDTKADVFSIGVVAAELLLQRHLIPGKPNDAASQLLRTMELVGTPTEAQLNDPANPYFKASDNARQFMMRVAQKKPLRGNIGELRFTVPCAANVMDLLKSLLQFDPRQRPSAEEALAFAWFDPLREYITRELQALQTSEPPPRSVEPKTLPIAVSMIEALVPKYGETSS